MRSRPAFCDAAVLALLTVSLAAAPARKSAGPHPQIPDVDFKLGIQRIENGKLDRGVHILRLTCTSGYCTLSTLSVNECSESPLTGNESFYPSFDIKSMKTGNLKVSRAGSTLVVEERGSDLGGDYVTTLRFGYEKRPWGGYALVQFTGGFVKNSALLGQVITAQFQPFTEHAEVVLNCPVRVPGLEPSLADNER